MRQSKKRRSVYSGSAALIQAQHFLRKPQESQPFILSSYGEDDIAKRLIWQAVFAACLMHLGSAVADSPYYNSQF